MIGKTQLVANARKAWEERQERVKEKSMYQLLLLENLEHPVLKALKLLLDFIIDAGWLIACYKFALSTRWF